MSDSESRDTDGDLGMNGDGKPSNVCRDFLRNVCRRGQSCKYRHPEPGEADGLGMRRSDFMFCHDFQNRECSRPNCKFLHCSREEEQQYRATGMIPQHVLESSKNPGSGNSESYPRNGEPPVCKDYTKGECRRGLHCKFRHVNPNEYDMDMDNGGMRGGRQDMYSHYNSYGLGGGYDSFEPEPKRRAFVDPSVRGGGDIARMMPSFNDLHILKEENMLLREKVEELRKQVADLTATNEFLLDQNQKLRFSKPASVPSQTLNHPAGSMAAMTQLSLSGNGLTTQRMASGAVPAATLGQGMAPMGYPSFSQSMMPMSTHSSNLVSYPIMAQSMQRPQMPHSLG